MTMKKRLGRPDSDSTSNLNFAQGAANFLGELNDLNKRIENETHNRLALPISAIKEFLDNTRKPPIPITRFIEIEWPSIHDPKRYELIAEIVKLEGYDEIRYTLESAIQFYERIYLLAYEVDELGLSQPVAVLEKAPGVYALIFGQRRFMACWISKILNVESTLFEIDISNKRLINQIQDSENDQHLDVELIDRIFAKKTRYEQYIEDNPFGIKSKDDLFTHMGVTRSDGYIFLMLFSSDQFMEVIDRVKSKNITSLFAIRQYFQSLKARAKTSPGRKHAYPALHEMGFVLKNGTDSKLLGHMVRSTIDALELSDKERKIYDELDLNKVEDLKLAIKIAADKVYE